MDKKYRLLSEIIFSASFIAVTGFTASADVDINSVNFPSYNLRNHVKKFYDTNKDDILSDAERLAVTEIDCSEKNISTMRGISYFDNLEVLHCYGNILTELDISANTKLQELDCSDNALTSLNVNNNPELTYIGCCNNKLGKINVKSNPKLESLEISGNSIVAVDVSANGELVKLLCDDNKISRLNLKNNPKLEVLNASSNNIKSVDLSANPILDSLVLSDNKITSLNLASNPALTYLHIDNNRLQSIDLSKNTHLYDLEARDNRLTNLDLSACKELGILHVENNAYKVSLNSARAYRFTRLNGFNPAKVSSLKGGSFKNNLIRFGNSGVASYIYDCGNGFKATFTLQTLDAPEISLGYVNKGVNITFGNVKKADKYVIYRKDAAEGSYKKIKTIKSKSKARNYVDKKAVASDANLGRFSYCVVPKGNKTASVIGQHSKSCYVQNVKITKGEHLDSGLKINFTSVDRYGNGKVDYNIYKRINGRYQLIGTVASGEMSGNQGYFVDGNVTAGNSYKYYVAVVLDGETEASLSKIKTLKY